MATYPYSCDQHALVETARPIGQDWAQAPVAGWAAGAGTAGLAAPVR